MPRAGSGLATGTTGVEERNHYLFSTNSVLLRAQHGGGSPAEDVYATEDSGNVDAAMPPCSSCFGSTSDTSEHRGAFFSSLPAPLIPSKKD